jgi:Plavaka transposase
MQQEGCDTDKKDDSDYIRPFRNFAWGHNLSNIHKMMAPDFLHQVLKGLTSEHLMHWIKGLIQSEIQAGKYRNLNILYTDGCG